MSAFEVSLTPTRVKKKAQSNENREPVSVIMAPFTAKSTVVFENVPVSKTARRFLIVINPTDDSLEVVLSKGLRCELNVTVDWESSRVPPQGSVQMELVWTPSKSITCSETIQFRDNRNFRKDVHIIFKSVSKTAAKNTTRYPNVTSKSSKPPPKMVKSLSSHAMTAPTLKHQPLSKISKSEMNICKPASNSEHKVRVDDHNDLKITSNHTKSPQTPAIMKENVSPETPQNASELFDKFRFTPATETKQTGNIEILSSMRTPVVGIKSERKCEHGPEDTISLLNPRRLSEDLTNSSEKQPRQGTPGKTPRWTPKIVRHSCTPPSGERHVYANAYEQHMVSSTAKRTTPDRLAHSSPTQYVDQRRKLFSNSPKQGINKTFELSNKSNDSLESAEGSREDVTTEPVMDKTTTLPCPQLRISTIMEEDEKSDLQFKFEKTAETVFMQKTFNLADNNLLRDVELVGTPLRKVCESMQDLSSKKQKVATQGSMPNLNEMETIQSIEHNRYYMQVQLEPDDSLVTLDTSNISVHSVRSVTSAQELLFDQHEILAHSSRFNVNEGSVKGNKKITCSQARKSPTLEKQQINKRLREPSIDSPTSVNLLSVDDYTPNACLMSVSPPKKSRMDLPETNSRPGTKFHVTKWSATQPKKLKLIRPQQNVCKKILTPRKIKTEPRVKLYDTDMFLQPYINPDPFAATTTFDPFLASTMYLDDGAIRKHEEELKKWLNALVALPADLDTNCSKKIDVGNLFNAVRNQELILAPTKEEQSMNYLTKSRMEALRKAAVNLYMSQEMIEVCSKVAIYINKHSIEIRKDRDLHLDVVLQRYILELLLSFNPLWLRLGLEVVFGEVIHLHSNSDILGLSTFILNRLFRDRFLEQKHARAFTLSEQYAAHIKKFSLQKILLLLLFLDKAKNKRIIKHNPCLFVVTSKYKETKEILLRFSSELLANIGDITRNLRRLGYVLTHKQSYIDEFNYAFKNLAVDLRDGVRLTRVMEIILLRDDLTNLLRVPAISRTQRVFNVNLGLRALAEANFTLTGGISAYDIVDGHREKTLSLLWQIIYKFRSPKFHAAATVVQQWWRNCWLGVVIRRRIQVKIEERRNVAATKIQSAYRGHLERRRTSKWKKERVMAIIALQKYVRGFLCRKRFVKTVSKIVLLQRWFRATQLKKIERAKYLEMRYAAIKIQTWYRRLILSRKVILAATVIKEAKRQAKVYHEKVVVVQRIFRSYVIRKKLRILVQQVVHRIRSQKVEYKSAARIQSFFRMISKRREYLAQRGSAVKIQRVWRSYKLTQTIRVTFLEQRRAVVTIQRYFRGFLNMRREQLNYQELRASAIVIQRRYRAKMQAKLQRQEFLRLKGAAVTVQRRARATMLMRQQREKYLKLLYSVRYVQQKYRAKVLMQRDREAYKKLKSITITIQQHLRATLLARKIRLEYLSLQYHVILTQQRFRANRLMRKEKSQYLRLKSAVLFVQQRYRAQLAMRAARKKYLMQRNAVVVLQTRLRAQWKMRSQRLEYLSLKKSAITVQQRFRALILGKTQRTKYMRLKDATICIQQRYRATIQMRFDRHNFEKMKQAAILLQRKFRALIAMRKQREEFLALKVATRTIQQRFRARRDMNRKRNRFLHLKLVTVNMQRRYRATKLMLREQAAFKRTRTAALCIQRRFRANREMRKERNDYLALKKSVVTIQQRFRAQTCMKIVRVEYTMYRSKTIVIQRYVRGYLLMKRVREDFLRLKRATINIQTWWRRVALQRVERRRYLTTITAVRTLQIRWRANLMMRATRRDYLANRDKIICIQRYFRSYLLMKADRYDFCKLQEAAICLQRRFRARQQMLKHRNNFLALRTATIKIQRQFRSLRTTKSIRQHYLQLRRTVILIQQKFRAKKLYNAEHEAYNRIRYATVNLQRYIRGHLARKRFVDMLTPERREEIRRRNAVRIIQKYWRGYRIRKRWHSVKFQSMRNRLKLLKAQSKPTNTIRHQILASVQILKQRYYTSDLLSILIRLENLSRVVPHTLKEHAAFIASFAYGIMAQANRSEPDKQVIELCSRIILNFSRYGETKEDVFQESGLVTIAQMLLRWSDKDCPIFNTLCTLVWVFIHCEEKKKVIREFMTTREATYMLRETKKMVLRKEKMRMHSRKPNHIQHQQSQPSSPILSRQALPLLESDFGISKKSPYNFNCSVFALDTILLILDISV